MGFLRNWVYNRLDKIFESWLKFKIKKTNLWIKESEDRFKRLFNDYTSDEFRKLNDRIAQDLIVRTNRTTDQYVQNHLDSIIRCHIIELVFSKEYDQSMSLEEMRDKFVFDPKFQEFQRVFRDRIKELFEIEKNNIENVPSYLVRIVENINNLQLEKK